MDFLITLLCAVIALFGTWAFLKFIIEPSRTESLKMKVHIRDLDWRNKQLKAGVNPDGMPFDYDHSRDYHNYNCTCDQCKRIGPENEARVARDVEKIKTLRGY